MTDPDDRLPRRRFAIRLILFLAPVVVVLGGYEAWLRLTPNTFSTKRASMARAAPTTEILFLGPSTALEGIRPDVMRAPAYNLSFIGQSIWYDAKLLDKYLDEFPRLRLVVFTIDYHTLEYDSSRGESACQQFLYADYFGLPAEGSIDALDVRRWSFTALGAEFFANRHPVDASGWEPNPRAQQLLTPRDAVNFMDSHLSQMHDDAYPRNVALLEETTKRLAARGIAAAYVTLPTWSAYRRRGRPSDRARTVDTLRRLQRESGAIFADYYDDPRFGEDDLGDPIHLSVRGATHLSQVIDSEVVGPALRR